MFLRHIVHYIIVALIAVWLTGCGSSVSYDRCLIAADSLMQPSPDSALAVIMAIDTASLQHEGDRAYRDLLLTQARYKCYMDITVADDSAIDRALDYYRSHDGGQEKLTRSYLYKGAIMQELGHVDSAMYYYKSAEAVAADDDYANLGQINTRIGKLYLRFADKQTCYDKYKQALKYYKLTGNKRLQFDCLFNMSGCSSITLNDDAEGLLDQATQLALELNDSVGYYQCQELLCRQLSYKGNQLSRAKRIALHCLTGYRQFVDNDLLLDLADIYTYCGMADSARYYLGYLDESADVSNPGQVRARKYDILTRIARIAGDTALSNHYDKLAHRLSDSILNNKDKYQIQQLENEFNLHRLNKDQSRIGRLQWGFIVLSIIAVIIVAVMAALYLRRISNTKAIIRELKNQEVNNHDDLRKRLDTKSAVVGQLISNLVNLMKMSVAEARAYSSTPKVAQHIKKSVQDVADDDFWNELRAYLDRKHNGIISTIALNPEISDKDLRIIELSCCGFNYVEMAIILNYSPRYVINKRNSIAQKLELDNSLQEYLDSLMDPGMPEPMS